MFPKIQKPLIIKYRVYPSGDKITDCATQTTATNAENLACDLCNYKADTEYDLYSHLLTQCHKSAFTNKYFTCLRCKFKLNERSLDAHDCLKHKSTFIKHICRNSIKFGLPFICLLCRGRRFRSKAVLFVHLLCYHSPPIDNSSTDPTKKCGLCTYRSKKKTNNKTKSKQIDKKLEEYRLPIYNDEFDRHIEEEHIHGYDMAFVHQLNADTERRQPYACVACPSILASNDQFHAHIICQHAARNEYDRELCVCVVCNVPYWSADKFVDHVNNTHTLPYRHLAVHLSKDGYIDNYVDLQTTCVYCWSCFDKRLQLHSHLLINHSYFSMSLQCGLCNYDFRLNKDVKETYELFKRHNEAHYSQFELKTDLFTLPKIISTTIDEITNNKNKKTRGRNAKSISKSK